MKSSQFAHSDKMEKLLSLEQFIFIMTKSPCVLQLKISKVPVCRAPPAVHM